MDLALTILDGLRQIYTLQNAIRRQRSVNRHTYRQMMEIFVELQLSGPIQGNATLQRTAAIQKFLEAVANFSRYLQKFNAMHRVGRLFKFARMERERLIIVDEIDEILRMHNFASSMTVLNGEAAASSHAARLFAKLEIMHGRWPCPGSHTESRSSGADSCQSRLSGTRSKPAAERRRWRRLR